MRIEKRLFEVYWGFHDVESPFCNSGEQLSIAVPEVQSFCNGSDNPGEAVKHIEGCDRMEPCEDGVDPDHAEDAGAQDHDDHRDNAFSDSAGGRNGAVHKGCESIGKPHNMDPFHAGIDDGRLRSESRKKLTSKKHQEDAEDRCSAEGIQQGDKVSLNDTILLSGTPVLTHKGRAAGIIGRQHIEDQGICVGSSGISGDHDGAEGIDSGLHKQVCDGKNGILDPGRNAEEQDTFGGLFMKAQLLQAQAAFILSAEQIQKDQSGRNILGDNTGCGNTVGGHMTPDHEEQIQDYVKNTGSGQVDQWSCSVTAGTENAVSKVVDCHGRHAKSIDFQIQNSTVHQLVLGVQKSKHIRRKDNADHADEHAQRQAEQQRGMNDLIGVFRIISAQSMGSPDIDAGAHTNKETGKQRYKERGGADASQCLVAGKPSDNCHIAQIEHDLQHLRECKRDAEQQKIFPERAFRHGNVLSGAFCSCFFHVKIPPYKTSDGTDCFDLQEVHRMVFPAQSDTCHYV